MAVSIITAIILYFITVYYLDIRYKVEVKEKLEHYSLKRKRNLIFAGMYLVLSIIIGFLYTQYNYIALTIVKAVYIIAFSIVFAYIDYKETIIPNKLLAVLLWSAIIIHLIEIAIVPDRWINIVGSSVIGMLVGGGVFLIGHMISKEGIGAGDIKLFAVMGFFLGNYIIVAVMLVSLLVAAIVGGIGVLSKKMKLKQAVPFAPYVAIGVIVTMILGF
jgi:Type II secretory pathway, prepilin signal peptidase PulO and related peptidases